MSNIHVKREQVVNAKPEDVYAVLADYKGKHKQILTPNFQDYNVEKGGRGSGTVVSYRLLAGGRERFYRMRVDEPVKGKVITERDSDSSLVTTWTLSPLKGGQQTKVSLASEWTGGTGVGGFFERVFAPIGLRRIYTNMLSLLKMLVQPPDKSTEIEKSKGGVVSKIGPLLLIVALLQAFGSVVRYLRKA